MSIFGTRNFKALLALFCAFIFAAPADAQLSSTHAGRGTPGGGSTPFSLTWISQNNSTVAGTSFSFAAQNIGTADPTRIVAVAVSAQNASATISNVSIGGSTATQATSAAGTNTNGDNTDIWYLAVSSGTTATIAVTTAVSAARCVIQVYSVIGTGAAFSSANNASNSGTVSSITATVTAPVGGGTIGIADVHNNGETISGSNLTTDTGNNLVVGGSTYGVGHDTSHSGSTAFGFSWTPTAVDVALSVATFSP